MTTSEALTLKKYDNIKVRRPFGKTNRRAVVIDPPQQVGEYVVIGFAYRRHDDETIGSGYHAAVIPQDTVTRDW